MITTLPASLRTTCTATAPEAVRTFRTYATARTYPFSTPNHPTGPPNQQVSQAPVEKPAEGDLIQVRKPPPGRSLADVEPQLAGEWHPTLNGDLTPVYVFPGSDKMAWWRCSKCQRDWQTTVSKRAKRGQGCRDCSAARRAKLQATPERGQSLAELMPQIAAEWHPTLNGELTPSDVVPGSGKKVWWRCSKCQHEWETVVNSRARGSGCRECWLVRKAVLRATPKQGQSFGDLYPEVAEEWHPTRNGDVKPTDVKPGSNKPRWWECRKCGHEWEVAPKDRRRGEQCPECAERQRSLTKSTPKAGQSLLDLYPDIAAEWHPSKNESVTAADVNPGSKIRRWWKCRQCGHEWQTDPDHRTRGGRSCSKCSYQYRSRVKATPKPGES
jgi:predicted  nucleic acid-binding Zn-ribbon protein